jgi:hypothetical protein
MGEIKRIVIDEKEFMFYCDSRSTRHGFAHDVELFVNGKPKEKTACHYLNRTWECWQYQTAICSVIRQYMNRYAGYMLDDFKFDNKIKRLTAQKKADFEALRDADGFYKTLVKLLDYAKNERL